MASQGNAVPPTSQLALAPKRLTVRYVWEVFTARVDEEFPLLCLMCGGKCA